MKVRPMVLLALGLATAVTASGCESPGYRDLPRPTPDPVAHATLPAVPGRYLGVYEPGTGNSYLPISGFAAMVGRSPNVNLYYSGWFEGFQWGFARRAYAHGAVPFVQINPTGINIAGIAHGQYDVFLRRYAIQVREWQHPVMISFGHEMNGPWYSWGFHHVPPQTWIAAWRHIVTVFRAEGAQNVTWVWTINRLNRGIGAPRHWWPGDRYVTWVGIDGYLETPRDSFSDVFRPAIRAVHRLTRKPILLAETAIGPASGQTIKIPNLFTGIKANRLLGLVWFDVTQHHGIHHQDWRLEDSPSAATVFRRQLARLHIER